MENEKNISYISNGLECIQKEIDVLKHTLKELDIKPKEEIISIENSEEKSGVENNVTSDEKIEISPVSEGKNNIRKRRRGTKYMNECDVCGKPAILSDCYALVCPDCRKYDIGILKRIGTLIEENNDLKEENYNLKRENKLLKERVEYGT